VLPAGVNVASFESRSDWKIEEKDVSGKCVGGNADWLDPDPANRWISLHAEAHNEVRVGSEHRPETDERSHDRDVHMDCAIAIENAGEHSTYPCSVKA